MTELSTSKALCLSKEVSLVQDAGLSSKNWIPPIKVSFLSSQLHPSP